MKYKISNIATKQQLVNFTGILFKHPELYQQKLVITGKEETIIPVITQENQQEISFAIWGLLPNSYDEDWSEFQNLIDTLTIKYNELNSSMLGNNVLNLKRCLIIATGFFTSYLQNGKIQQYYITAKDKKPFYLAGYYNQLNDGFLTFALLLKNQDDSIKKIQNLTEYMPTFINKKFKKMWLSDGITNQNIVQFINTQNKIALDIKLVDHTFEYEKN